jgi:hypothetical protein
MAAHVARRRILLMTDLAPFVAPSAPLVTEPNLRMRTAFRQRGLQIFNPAPHRQRCGRIVASGAKWLIFQLARRARVTGWRPVFYRKASHASRAHQCGDCGFIRSGWIANVKFCHRGLTIPILFETHLVRNTLGLFREIIASIIARRRSELPLPRLRGRDCKWRSYPSPAP